MRSIVISLVLMALSSSAFAYEASGIVTPKKGEIVCKASSASEAELGDTLKTFTLVKGGMSYNSVYTVLNRYIRPTEVHADVMIFDNGDGTLKIRVGPARDFPSSKISKVEVQAVQVAPIRPFNETESWAEKVLETDELVIYCGSNR